ncbi:MAG: ribosomal RNA small subunit methyltransferase A [Candidatus Methanoperedens sp.]|nr:ribosomal RNA small subunit methyltransferase A [Candidatus Methanoperedens sp.]MCE8426255.1 ribosomal RNA small subunit methyltransferase A [Candidatus Methanoperedens sp.]MCE8429062.1 ribosomal RNA small subunit methyltransferase A [Candidatus Methanoperedens sp.]
MKWYKKDQHFLTDKQVLKRIIEYGEIKSEETVLEIGAGAGNLTLELAKKAEKVIAIEIDPELATSIPVLRNVEVIMDDALKIEFPLFNKVISNLPYSISSPVTFKLMRHEFDFGILMYQYEFAKRMLASPGNKDYGRLSIAIQYYADVELLEIVPRTAFSTLPEVRSAIIKLTPHQPPYKVQNEAFFMRFIKAAFSQRRKKLKNAIINNAGFLGIEDDSIKELPVRMQEKRAEDLSPDELAELADILFSRKHSKKSNKIK